MQTLLDFKSFSHPALSSGPSTLTAQTKQQALYSLVLPALTAVILPGASAGHAAWDYVVPASPGGSKLRSSMYFGKNPH